MAWNHSPRTYVVQEAEPPAHGHQRQGADGKVRETVATHRRRCGLGLGLGLGEGFVGAVGGCGLR